ncbi:hypothetical protein UFOVP130_70 [uncultured Caudovirales phage]|uniref:Uncharacterized protein n=1 Tax=uncultured Caudovirales phage TaxID=2100421 RepID=A0A6J5LA15_9CAUD|nr:hypothetical protein UFOVP130_70 [uncultured Caudovirales phage]
MSMEVVRAEQQLPAIVSEPSDKLTNVQRLGKILAASGYFSDVRDMAQAAVKVMAGEELGIAPVAAVMGIHIIKGKVTLSANLIAAQVRRHGYNFRHQRFDNTGCALEFTGKQGEVLGESSFTEEDAKSSGVYNDMYKKFPRNMYFARAVSNGAKWYCPEVMSGLPVYVPEELGARVDGDGDLIVDEPVIDTGGHPANSRAAQEYVRDKKLAAMKSQQQTEPAEQPKAPYQGTDADIPANMGGTWVDTDPNRTERRVEDMRQRIEQPATAAPAEKPWTTFKGMIAAFAEVKAALLAATGNDAAYYGELDLRGVKHANAFTNSADAIACYRALQANLAGVGAKEAA